MFHDGRDFCVSFVHCCFSWFNKYLWTKWFLSANHQIACDPLGSTFRIFKKYFQASIIMNNIKSHNTEYTVDSKLSIDRMMGTFIIKLTGFFLFLLLFAYFLQ